MRGFNQQGDTSVPSSPANVLEMMQELMEQENGNLIWNLLSYKVVIILVAPNLFFFTPNL